MATTTGPQPPQASTQPPSFPTTQALAPAAGEAVDGILIYIAARATALLRDRLGADSTGTVAALREIASLTDEALSAAGAAPAVPAAPARDSAKAIGAAILEAALAGNTNVPVGTVLGLGGRRFTFSPDFAEDSAPWHYAGGGDVAEDDMPSWSSSADLVGAGAEVIAVPVPVDEMAPEPAAKTPADDSMAGRLLRAAQTSARIIERCGSRIFNPDVDDRGYLHAITTTRDPAPGESGTAAALRRLRECVDILGLTVRAHRSGEATHIIGERAIEDVTAEISCIVHPGTKAMDQACAWLAELGVEVKA